jgi:hypothetical protein
MNDLVPTNNAMMSFIDRAVRDPTFSVDKMERLLMLQQDLMKDNARHEFNLAMSAVQAQLQTVVRDRDNPHTRSRYATLQALDASARPVYTEHGFSVRFGTAAAPWEGWVRVTCELSHVGGYSEQHYLDGPLDAAGSQGKSNKTGIQAIGSTVSYLRRYLLMLVLNLVTADDADDDGEATRRDRQADVYSRRDQINAETPLRAAAAPMPRGDRVTEPTTEPAERTDAAWQTWLDKLRAACAVLQHRTEVVEVAERRSVADALATSPAWVRSEISAILAENYKRFGAEPEAAAPEWPGDDEVAIAGAEKVASG